MKTNKKLVLMSLTLLSVVFGAHAMDSERNIKKEWENLQFNTVTTQFPKKCPLCNKDLSYVISNYFGEDSTKKFLILKALPCHEGICHKSSANYTSMNDFNRIELAYNPTNKKIVTEKLELETITPTRPVKGHYKLLIEDHREPVYKTFDAPNAFALLDYFISPTQTKIVGSTEKRIYSTYNFQGYDIHTDSITDIELSDEYDHLNIFDIAKMPENCVFSASSAPKESFLETTTYDDAIIVAQAETSNKKSALIVFGVKPCRPLCCLTKKQILPWDRVFVKKDGTSIYYFDATALTITAFSLFKNKDEQDLKAGVKDVDTFRNVLLKFQN